MKKGRFFRNALTVVLALYLSVSLHAQEGIYFTESRTLVYSSSAEKNHFDYPGNSTTRVLMTDTMDVVRWTASLQKGQGKIQPNHNRWIDRTLFTLNAHFPHLNKSEVKIRFNAGRSRFTPERFLKISSYSLVLTFKIV